MATADVRAALMKAGDSPDDANSYTYPAADQYRKQVDANWEVDVVQRVVPSLLGQRASTIGTDTTNWLLTLAANRAQSTPT